MNRHSTTLCPRDHLLGSLWGLSSVDGWECALVCLLPAASPGLGGLLRPAGICLARPRGLPQTAAPVCPSRGCRPGAPLLAPALGLQAVSTSQVEKESLGSPGSQTHSLVRSFQVLGDISVTFPVLSLLLCWNLPLSSSWQRVLGGFLGCHPPPVACLLTFHTTFFTNRSFDVEQVICIFLWDWCLLLLQGFPFSKFSSSWVIPATRQLCLSRLDLTTSSDGFLWRVGFYF